MANKLVESLVAWIAFDWADKEHTFVYQGMDWTISDRVRGKVKHAYQAISNLVLQLRETFETGLIAVVLEQSRGSLIYSLMKYDFFVFYPVNPKAFAKYREALCGSGAKDDPSDAELLLEFVLKHPHRHHAWVPEQAQVRKLRSLVEFRRKLVHKRTALTNQITSHLKNYFPQALQWAGNLASLQACDFLIRWPTLELLQKSEPESIREFYLQHRCRRSNLLENRLQEIAQANPFLTDAAVVDPSRMLVETLAIFVKQMTLSIQKFDNQIDLLYQQYPDRYLYESLPGAGPVIGPRLAALMGLDRDRFQDAQQIQEFTGVAPVTKRSGRSLQIHFRLGAPKFLRQTMQEFAAHSIPNSAWAKAYYQKQRQSGKKHPAAVRALAFKWIRILFRCWKDRTPYNEQHHLSNQTNKSPKKRKKA